MVTRLNYVGPMLAFDGSHSRAQHTASNALLMALREMPTTTFVMIAETPRKRYSPAHDKAADAGKASHSEHVPSHRDGRKGRAAGQPLTFISLEATAAPP